MQVSVDPACVSDSTEFCMRQFIVPALALLTIGTVVGVEYARSTATQGGPALSCRPGAHAMARLEMIFGTARSQGGPVTDEEWVSFLDGEVTPRFPQGMTTLRGPGQWRGSDGRLVREESRVLVILYEPASRTDEDIEAIRSAYKQRFAQESVMRIDAASCVSF